ncbi:hypothetical protein AB1Y20_000077 [Prymnesium parvum]|uniref:COX assembly mitochondrial protein n=1 Tax=Prymnesium parvum TaxID=97485 RepID=A0AB34K6S6_PRYPA
MAEGDDAMVRQLQQRFRERSLALCGDEFGAVVSCAGSACERAKQQLLQCMQSQVCEVLFSKLQQCAATPQSDCRQIEASLNRCLAFGYSSLPPPATR